MTKTVKDAPADWAWWWSSDEERFHGPCYSRADAIIEAWAEGRRGTIFICQAVHGELCTDLFDADDLQERFDDANEEAQDGEGDALSSGIPPEAWKKLAEGFDRQVKALVRKHGVSAWTFSGQSGIDQVDLSEPHLAMLPTEARELLGELAAGFSPECGYAPSYIDTVVADLKEALAPPAAPPVATS